MFATSTSFASKFTSLQPTGYPLAAKRYTCSYPLTLRFSDDEDEGYLEDVRSLMGLPISSQDSRRFRFFKWNKAVEPSRPNFITFLLASEFSRWNHFQGPSKPKYELYIAKDGWSSLFRPNVELYITICSSCRSYHFCAR